MAVRARLEVLGPYIERAGQSISDAIMEQAAATREQAVAMREASFPHWAKMLLAVVGIVTILVMIADAASKAIIRLDSRRHRNDDSSLSFFLFLLSLLFGLGLGKLLFFIQ
ncbi:hypothetical protein B0T26DRAFT_695559 [Lasiosphaeria miniovina]|uniref:Uncharacterized protein n=1 Tax=Lasiosphaeria miniovina TaxID=1954250 RepID=A0AA40B5I5_9PEZI|nr:uncharacterized protein B0T26DRAFT_695559 [Lasiosphaeria miniovina]KAK0727733.1 hypothetical protein B0T26DRAFT_695559 [Lasiosphaeria miniovina]